MKKSICFTKVTALALAAFTLSAIGQLHATNIAIGATGITGVNPNDDGSTGTDKANPGGSEGRINDGDLTSTVDTFSGSVLGGYSYFGVLFSVPTTFSITSVDIYTHNFGDGGPFGINGGFNGPGGTELATDLVAPEVQVFDGFSWTDVANTNDYVANNTGAAGGSNTLSTYTLSTPVTGVEGIRLLGLNSSKGANPYAFAGATEFEVNASAVPEPSTYALFGFGALALVVLRRRPLKA